MKALLKKEFIVSKQSVLIQLIPLIIISVLFMRVHNFSIITVVIFSCMQINSNEIEEHGVNSDIFMNSLPVTREKIILSKYLFNLVSGAVYFSVVIITSMFVPNTETFTISSLMVGITAVSLYISLYFPLKYLFGKENMVITNIVLVLIFIGIILRIVTVGEELDYWGMGSIIDGLNPLQFVSFSLIISCASLYVSFRHASRLYKNIDLK